MQYLNDRFGIIHKLIQPQVYSATTLTGFVTGKDSIIPTEKSWIPPKAYYADVALIKIQNKIHFFPENNLVGRVSDYSSGSFALDVLLEGWYQLEPHKKEALSRGKVLHDSLLVYRPKDNMTWLFDYEDYARTKAQKSSKPQLRSLRPSFV